MPKAKNKIKKIIAAVAISGAVAIAGFTITDITGMNQAKALIVNKVRTEQPLTIHEWQAYSQFVDQEIKKRGGIKFENVKSKKELSDRINSLLD